MSIKINYRGLIIVIPMVLALVVPIWYLNYAKTAALYFIGPNQEYDLVDSTRGWDFSLADAVSVTELGVWDSNNQSSPGKPGDGLNHPHIITIWNSGGTVIIAQATVPAGNGGLVLKGFRYVALTAPVRLEAGTYVISAYYPSAGDRCAAQAAKVSTASGVTYGQTRQEAGNAFPSSALATNGFFGPNFRFKR